MSVIMVPVEMRVVLNGQRSPKVPFDCCRACKSETEQIVAAIVLIGGGEDENGEDARIDCSNAADELKTLDEKLGDLTGISLCKSKFTGSATFGVTPNGLPTIGHVARMKNVFVTMTLAARRNVQSARHRHHLF
jgi:hypothetical protein